MTTSFSQGIHNLILGFTLISHKKLRHYVLIPFFINVILYIVLLVLAVHYFEEFTAWITAHLPTWLHWLTWLLWGLFLISWYLALAYTFTFLANLVAAPFNSLLAAKTQWILTGQIPADENWSHVLKGSLGMFKREFTKLAYYFPRAIGFLILFLIPGVNIIASIAWFGFNAWMMALQYLDYPGEVNKYSAKEVLQFCRKHRGSSYGFGLMVMLTTLIPIVNFAVIPAAVCGAVAQWGTISRAN